MNEKEKDRCTVERLKGSPGYPQRASEDIDDQAQFQGVYAGPAQMPVAVGNSVSEFSSPVAMVTYAGPEFMSNMVPFPMPGGAVPKADENVQENSKEPERAAGPGEKKCKMCGYINAAQSKFCTECGHIMDGSE